MSNNFQYKSIAFQQAEKNLLEKEQKLLYTNKIPIDTVKISDAVCGVSFYRISASANYQNSIAKLQSIIAKTRNTNHCKQKPNIKSGRIAWREE